MCAPSYERLALGIVAGEIIFRNFNRSAEIEVTEILAL